MLMYSGWHIFHPHAHVLQWKVTNSCLGSFSPKERTAVRFLQFVVYGSEQGFPKTEPGAGHNKCKKFISVSYFWSVLINSLDFVCHKLPWGTHRVKYLICGIQTASILSQSIDGKTLEMFDNSLDWWPNNHCDLCHLFDSMMKDWCQHASEFVSRCVMTNKDILQREPGNFLVIFVSPLTHFESRKHSFPNIV